MYEDQPLFAEIDGFLRDLGFVFHRFAPTVSHTNKPMLTNNDPSAGLSQFVWADAVSIRDFVHPEAISTAQLLKLTIIVHDCYRSYDLALHPALGARPTHRDSPWPETCGRYHVTGGQCRCAR